MEEQAYPVGHDVHTDAPPTEYVPAAQAGVSIPVVVLHLYPAGHAVQLELPPVL